MSFLNKVYTSQGHENFDAWLKSAGIPEDRISSFLSDKSTLKYEKDGDTYTVTESYTNGHNATKTFKSGVEFDDVNADKTLSKTTYTVDGNTVTQVIKSDKGSATFKRVFNGDDLTVEITSDAYNGVAKRFYKA